MNSLKGWIGACAAAVGLALSCSTYAVHDTSTFELDRDAVDSNAADTSPDDWNTVNLPLPNGSGGHSFAHTGVISDPVPEASIFTSGGSKDNNDISQWKWKKASNILDKDNITNAYAAAYAVDHDGNPATAPHLVVYFGLDRFSNSGSAQVGFWFLKSTVTLNGDGTSGGGDTFNGVHQNGDILVQSNFSNGGVVATVTVFEWSGGNLVQIASGGDCIPGSSGDAVCATVNQDADPSTNLAPWDYTPKANEGQPKFFPHGTFFEGGIDLTALGLTDACFSTFLAETRSSTPFDSVLKDFVGPHAFNTCTVEVTKACTNARLDTAQTHIKYDISGKVTASGFGSSLFDVALSDSPAADGTFQQVDCADSSKVLGSFPLDTLNGDACYKNTITVLLTQNGLSDTVTATANTQDNGSGIALTASATAKCPVLKVSPKLSVTKSCRTIVEVLGGKVVAKVNVSGKVCNDGTSTDGNLTGVTVVDNPATIASLVDGITLAPGACQNYTGAYYPSVANNASDQGTNCPSDVVFKDSVTASAKDIFGAPVTDQSVSADCKLCPEGGCPAP